MYDFILKFLGYKNMTGEEDSIKVDWSDSFFKKLNITKVDDRYFLWTL